MGYEFENEHLEKAALEFVKVFREVHGEKATWKEAVDYLDLLQIKIISENGEEPFVEMIKKNLLT